VAEPDQFTLDASVTPPRVLPRHPQYQRPDRLGERWPAWLSSRVGPPAGDQVGMPAQQGSR
jgi:hypothetical protein